MDRWCNREVRMSVHKVIEVKAQSPKGWEDAARMAVAEASETVKGIKSVWIEGMQGVVEGGEITAYRVNAKITFEVETNR
jgi:flavin-binding protein dodecin